MCPDVAEAGDERAAGLGSGWRATLACALMLAASAAGAATLDARVTQRAVYDSSPRLAVGQNEAIAGYLLQPRVALKAAPGNWEISTALRAVLPWYDDSNFNLDEQRLDLFFSRSMPNSTFTVDVDLDRGSTLNDLVNEDGSVIPDTNDINEVVATRRATASVRPQWGRALGPRAFLQVGGLLSWVDFDQTTEELIFGDEVFTLNRGFTDYRYQSADLTLQRSITARTSLTGTATVSRLLTDSRSVFAGNVIEFVPPDMLIERPVVLGIGNRNLNRQVLAGITHRFSSTVTATVQAGASFVESTSDQTDIVVNGPTVFISDETTGGIFQGNITWETRRTNVRFDASRSLNPSGVGQLLEQDSVELFARRRVTRTLDVSLRLSFVRRDRILEGNVLARDVYRVDPTLRWRFRRNWIALAGARIGSVTGFAFEERTQGARVFLGLTYEFNKKRLF